MIVTVRRVVHVGVYAAGEQVVEGCIERGSLKEARADVIPREGGQVAQIEDERVAEHYGLLEPGPGRENGKDPIRTRPRVGQPLLHRLSPVSYTHLRAHETPEHLV